MPKTQSQLIEDGEFWEEQGNIEAAIKYYEKATHKRGPQSVKDRIALKIQKLKKEVKNG